MPLSSLPSYEITLSGYEHLRDVVEGLDKGLKGDRLEEPWRRVVEAVMSSALIHAPVWNKHLLHSIDEEVLVEEGEIAGVVFSDLTYAPFQERGTDPYFPNVDAIADWALDHGWAPYQLALLIADKGLEPKKFFEQALKENEELILTLVGEVVAEIMEARY